MLKFFRRIRKKLLAEGKLKSYFFYAIGEILLVVIGILIALQINTWNENRKLRQVEIKTLMELKMGLVSDLEDMQGKLLYHKEAKNACDVLLDHFEKSLPYNDSLDSHFDDFMNISMFITRAGPFETLKARGMEIISNEKLRSDITRIYDFDYEFLMEVQRKDHNDFEEKKKWAFQNLKNWQPGTSVPPQNYEELKEDFQFRNRLSYTAFLKSLTINQYQNTMSLCWSLINAIDEEILRLGGTDLPEKKKVRFTLKGHNTATKVILAGSFNNWYEVCPMENKDGVWQKEIELVPDSTYQYKFIIDGKWMHDSDNPKTAPDGNGGFNSVINVPSDEKGKS